MFALSADFLARTLPILAPRNPCTLPSLQSYCLQLAVKARKRALTLTQTLWAGIRRSRLSCWVHGHPLHYCRSSSSGLNMLEPTFTVKNHRTCSLPERSFCYRQVLSLGGQLGAVGGQTDSWRICLWEGNVRLMMKQIFCSCVLPLPAGTCLWELGGLVGGCPPGTWYQEPEHTSRQPGTWLMGIQTVGSFAVCASVLTSWLGFTCRACWWLQSLRFIYRNFNFDYIFPIHFETGKSRVFSQQSTLIFYGAKLSWSCRSSPSYPASTAGMGRKGSWALTGSLNWESLCMVKVSTVFQHNWGNDKVWG